MTEARQKKIAVIGASGPRYESREVRVECFPWNRLKKVANLADYDVVIFDLLSTQEKEHVDGALKKALDITTARRVLRKSGGAFFVLGDPRFSIKWRSTEGEQSAPFLYWTGIEFAWDERPGDTVERYWEASSGPFKPFADALSRWHYSLVAARPEPKGFAEVWNVEYLRSNAYQPAVLINPICDNSYGNHLVFFVSHAEEQIAFQNGLQVSGAKNALSGPIYFLRKLGWKN